jgi:hypothetical protein
MPLLGALLYAINFCCLIHAVRTRREKYWVYVLVMAPGAGALAYLLFELLPEVSQSRTVQKVAADVSQALDPERTFRERLQALQATDTIENRLQLADECMARSMWSDAARLYEEALRPPLHNEPVTLLKLAQARLELADGEGALDALERLRQQGGHGRNQAAHLAYARALESVGRVAEARSELFDLSGYATGPEAGTRLGLLLQREGNPAGARAQFGRVLDTFGKRRKWLTPAERDWLNVCERNLA